MQNLFTSKEKIGFSAIRFKVFILCAIVIVFVTKTGSSQTIFSEDWESGIGSWFADNGVWDVGIPTVGPTSTHSGVNCAGTVLNGNYPDNANTRLISPSITLPTPSGEETIQLKFWHWFRIEDNLDQGVLQISENSGAWQTISSVEFDGHGGEPVWTQYVADLTSYAGSSIRIGFYFTSNPAFFEIEGWYIDDVSIETSVVNLPNPEDFELGIGNWSADNGVWEVGEPTTGPPATHSGTKCAGTVLNGNYPPHANTRLISPEVTLTPIPGQNPMLFFYHWFKIENNLDKGFIQISVDGGNWQTVSNPIEGTNETWSQFGVDLSAYVDSTIRIAFYFTSNPAFFEIEGWYIDDIRIDGIEIIPVELTSFTAIVSDGDVLLNWSTATETNNQGFEIQRRNENNEYQKIGYVPGHGTTTQIQNYSYIDSKVVSGNYFYRLKQIDFDGSFEYSDEIEVEVSGPLTFALEQNYPNPFNPSTSIQYAISSRQFVTLKVYDVLGNEVATLVNKEKAEGSYEIGFDAAGLSSGIYFYRLQAGSFVETKKLILLR